MTTEQPTRQERIAEQTEVRRALLRNGYSPFPCEGKNGQIFGWPSIQATEELIDEWSGQMRWVSTAVHAGRDGLVGLDVDIDDAEAFEDFENRIPDELWERLKAAPRRRGGGVKEMWLVRLREGESSRHHKETTGKWGDPSSSEDDSDHKLEIWAQESKLLALYGARMVERREVVDEYSWVDGRGPDTVALEDLPEVGVEDFDVLLRCAVEAMQARGWDRLDVAEPKGDAADRVFDLTDDMTFITRDHGEVGLAELEDLCGAYDEVRMYSWLPGKRRRADRCSAKLNDYDGLLQIYDYDTEKTHRKAEADGAYTRQIVEGTRAAAERLGEVLGKKTGGAQDEAPVLSRLEQLAAAVPVESRMFGNSGSDEGGGGPTEDEVQAHRQEVVESLLDRYAYWSDSKGFVVDVFRGPEAAMTLGSFGAKMEPWGWVEYGPRGGEKEINPADLWRKDPRRLDVGGYRFLPWSRDRLVKVAGEVYVNTWERPAWWDDAGDVGNTDGYSLAVDAFKAFLEHLIPDEAERSWFIQWVAAKVQKPWLPNCGVIMVAERQGTGRGTLFDILRGVFGARHVRNVGSGQLLGNGSQAQYNDWIADSLLVTCDEVLTGDDSGGAMAWKRREAYERLKGLVDPRARDIQIVRKGLPNTAGEVFASFLLATNNVNALPLSPDDRRIAVVTNSSVPLIHRRGVMERLAPWRTDVGFTEAMAEAVYRWLCGIEVEWNAIREAPTWMAGRARMLAANEGDLESVLDSVLQEIPGDYILAGHLRERLGKALEAAGLDREIKAWWVRASDLLGRINNFGWRRRDGRCKFQPRSMGNQVSLVFYRDEPGRLEAWENASLEERAKMWSKSKDLNAKLSALQTKMQERGLRVEK